ncbi:MAG: FkbM family methyltransferase [Pseudomonadota bacterium]
MFGTSHRNVPLWLENNVIFRKLFILRKLFFSRNRFSHYAGAAEDVAIARLFHKNYQGFFVDVGCYHPIKFSNTWLLYKRGWRGINIDIDSIKVEMFNYVRRHDINIQCAVSGKNGVATFYKQGFFSQISSLEPTVGNTPSRVLEVECRTLSSILDSTRYKNRGIDLLSIDAEGHDLEVLQSLDFARYAPSLIVVETHDGTLDVIERSALYKYLRSMEYTMVGWCGESLLMAGKALQQKLTPHGGGGPSRGGVSA